MAIPENYKDSPIGKYKTVGELSKGYENAQKLIGAKGVIVPGENATPEDIEKFYNTLGRPEKPEGYKFQPLDNLHPELKMTPEVEAGFNQFVHKHGLTQKQADGVRSEYFNALNTSLVKRDETTNAKRHEAETKLRNEWGADYDNNLKQAKAMLGKYGGEEMNAYANEAAGNDPRLIRFLANIGKKFSEDKFVSGDKFNNHIGGAQKKINEILLNKEHPYHKKGIGHDEAVQEMYRLYEITTPNERELPA